MTAALTLCGLTIGYRTGRRTTTVAAGLRAQARRGELSVLLGPNGCGKSTLLRTLSGLQPALDGRVLLDGADVGKLTPDELARRIAVVLTERVDPGLLSVRELVGLGRIPHLGISARMRAADHAVVDWALAAVDAGELAQRPAAELSDGQRQRVLTARALAQQPSVLILDEPTAFLDVPSRAGLVEVLRSLAREHGLAIVMSTHDLELALRVADRAWLLDRDGQLLDAIPEDLVLEGRINTLFDGDTLRFDTASGVFEVRGRQGRPARIDAPDPLRAVLQRVLSREGWQPGEPAEIVVAATGKDRIHVHTGATPATPTTLDKLPELLRSAPATERRCASDVAQTLADIATVSPYFTVTTGSLHEDGWQPVRRLYTDIDLLGAIVDRVRTRINADERRVGVSTFYLGLAARLWSVGLGALAGHGVLPDLTGEQLLFHESGGQIRLHIEHPMAWQGDNLEPLLADTVIDVHLAALTAALRELGPVSAGLLRGNSASGLLSAGRVFDRATGTDRGWQLARRLCADERLTGAVVFDGDGYRRTSCCLYYRTPGGGVCGDCVFTTKPATKEKP